MRSFEQYLRQNQNEILALQVLFSRPYRRRLTSEMVTDLAERLASPPRCWTSARLWQAYETLDRSRVRGSSLRVLADVVALVRFALGQDGELRPYVDQVRQRFERWLAQ
ncbi:MAG: restriction endonuclease subunit R, partial [Candidatus Rokubacteria bacterium]|nr:restriction endonuclease subunit R [Candidatus Rokubacteria bacterium]